MHIVNGRYNNGVDYTFVSEQGASVIDYATVSSILHGKVKHFDIVGI